MLEFTDHELLAEFARTESEDAFGALITRYINLVYSAALRSTGNAHHAEEISQAAWMRGWERLGQLRSDELVSTWVDDEIADGFVVRPSSVHTDLPALVDGVVPLLRAADRFRAGYPGTTLRDTLGLPLAADRYAATA